MRAEKKKLELEKQKYYDALLRIKSSFYETKVFSHLQSKVSGSDDKEQASNSDQINKSETQAPIQDSQNVIQSNS